MLLLRGGARAGRAAAGLAQHQLWQQQLHQLHQEQQLRQQQLLHYLHQEQQLTHLQQAGGSSGRGFASALAQQQLCPAAPQSGLLGVADLPQHIVLLRHGETAGLEALQEMRVPNFRVPLSAHGVAEARRAGEAVQALLQQSAGGGRLFLFSSPFLRCIQTSQHVVRALRDDQLIGFQEEVQLREQDWGNFMAPGQQEKNYEDRLRYGRFFYRFPDGESAADVYSRMTMFQDHFVRDVACQRFAGSTVMLVSHGLALRLFLMRWLHWTVDEFLQVHNPPTAVPIVLTRDCTSLSDNACGASSGISPESIKACFSLHRNSLAVLRGVSPRMARGRPLISKQELLDWRPYLKQVPPPPTADPEHEAALHQLMEVGYNGAAGAMAA